LIAVYAQRWIDGTGVRTVIVEDAKALMNADNSGCGMGLADYLCPSTVGDLQGATVHS
jgi:hypothetical protein